MDIKDTAARMTFRPVLDVLRKATPTSPVVLRSPGAHPVVGLMKHQIEGARYTAMRWPTSAHFMTRAFSVLQANMNKQQGAQLSLLNGESLVDFSLLLLSEPSIIMDNEGRVLPIP